LTEPIVDSREIADDEAAVVTYDNPLDNVSDLAHHFFKRCLVSDGPNGPGSGVTPYIVTKKTVFKWQEPFWVIMKKVFDEHYLEEYAAKGYIAYIYGYLQ